MRGFQRNGRCEERGCRADRGLSDVAAAGQKEIATLARVPYVCRWSGDVLNASIYLVSSSSTDLGAYGAHSSASKGRQFFLPDPLPISYGGGPVVVWYFSREHFKVARLLPAPCRRHGRLRLAIARGTPCSEF